MTGKPPFHLLLKGERLVLARLKVLMLHSEVVMVMEIG